MNLNAPPVEAQVEALPVQEEPDTLVPTLVVISCAELTVLVAISIALLLRGC